MVQIKLNGKTAEEFKKMCEERDMKFAEFVRYMMQKEKEMK